MRLWSYFVTQILDTTSLQTNKFYETWFFGVTKSESLLQKYKNTVTFSTKKSVNVYEFFDMFDYTRRMGLTTDIFSFLFKVESQLKYHDLEINEKLQSSESFQFLWWNCLIRQNETKYAVFSKKKKRKTNKQTTVAIKYVICGKFRLAFCTIWLLSWSKGWFTKSAWRT